MKYYFFKRAKEQFFIFLKFFSFKKINFFILYLIKIIDVKVLKKNIVFNILYYYLGKKFINK